MAELLAPGVFIQEVPFGPQPIEGVSTSTAGFVGRTMWGPTEGALLVTSFLDFQRKFGGYHSDASGFPLPHAMRGFFENGGRRAYVARVVGSGAREARRPIPVLAQREVALMQPVVLAPGATVRLAVSSVFGQPGAAPGVRAPISVVERATGRAIELGVAGVDRIAGTIQASLAEGTPAAPVVARPESHFVRLGASANGTPTFRARHAGSYGNRIEVLLEPTYGRTQPILSVADDVVNVGSTEGLSEGDWVELSNASGSTLERRSVAAVLSAQSVRLNAAPGPGVTASIALAQWRLTVWYEGRVVESLTELSSNPATLVDQLTRRSDWVSLASAAEAPTIGTPPGFAQGRPIALAEGRDGAPPRPTDYLGLTGAAPVGLEALDRIDGINLIAVPGQGAREVVDAMIGQAERRKDRFAVFESQGPDGAHEVADVLAQRSRYNSSYAAMYHPWLRVRDPITQREIDLPPSGHVLGCFARTDNERGVWKAPANVTVRGILGFTRDISTGEQEVLNPQGINVLRQLEGLGSVIWGARTVSADSLWKYVSVRRLFIFIEQSIVRGTRWAVFEPNDTKLWKRIDGSVTNFLTTVWRDGGLFGDEPERAFFVKVDETTTTQDDRDNGRVNILVGIAPVKPAEFVVFRIGQAPTSIIIEENAS